MFYHSASLEWMKGKCNDRVEKLESETTPIMQIFSEPIMYGTGIHGMSLTNVESVLLIQMSAESTLRSLADNKARLDVSYKYKLHTNKYNVHKINGPCMSYSRADVKAPFTLFQLKYDSLFCPSLNC
jgi:hypothetical protein